MGRWRLLINRRGLEGSSAAAISRSQAQKQTDKAACSVLGRWTAPSSTLLWSRTHLGKWLPDWACI